MPSEKVESPEDAKFRQEMERFNSQEQITKIKNAELREKESRKQQKARYLQRDLTFDEMFKQSCARVYYMKSRKMEYTVPGSAAWDIPRVADKLLSRFKYNKKHADAAEALVQSAIRIGNEKLIAEYKTEADKHLTKCLHSHYGIGVLYGQFLDEARPIEIADPE